MMIEWMIFMFIEGMVVEGTAMVVLLMDEMMENMVVVVMMMEGKVDDR